MPPTSPPGGILRAGVAAHNINIIIIMNIIYLLFFSEMLPKLFTEKINN